MHVLKPPLYALFSLWLHLLLQNLCGDDKYHQDHPILEGGGPLSLTQTSLGSGWFRSINQMKVANLEMLVGC